jgi:hypothetical protein
MAQTEIEPTVKPEHAALIAELEAESSYVKLSKFLENLPDTKDGFDNFLGEIKFSTRHHFPPEKFAVLAGILTQIQENKTALQKMATLGERKRRLRISAELAKTRPAVIMSADSVGRLEKQENKVRKKNDER